MATDVLGIIFVAQAIPLPPVWCVIGQSFSLGSVTRPAL
jgi:hypothetical protein